MHLNYFIVGIAISALVVVPMLLFRKSTRKHSGGLITLGQLLALFSFVISLVATCFTVFDSHGAFDPKSLSPIFLPLFLIVFLQYLRKKGGDKSK